MGLITKDFVPFKTVQYHFYRLLDNGLLDVINEALVALIWHINGREAEPTAGIIDSQSVKTTKKGLGTKYQIINRMVIHSIYHNNDTKNHKVM